MLSSPARAAAASAALLLAPASIAIAAKSVAGPLSPEDFLVRGLEDVEPEYAKFDGSMYSGMMPLADEREASLFFWLFRPAAPVVDDSLVVWLNGGPGCSSMVGLLFENGPVVTPSFPAGTARTEEKPKLVHNPYSWTEATAMLYVEQPVGTGFSKGPREPQNEEDLSEDFHGFLRSFFDTFEDLRRHRLFVFGESYAGYYVPSIARYIHLQNKKLVESSQSNKPQTINLAGIALGNGWIDPVIQGQAVIDYAYWHGMIDIPTKNVLHYELKSCASERGRGSRGDEPPPFHPFTTPDECGTMGAVLEAAGDGAVDRDAAGAINTYDVTTWDVYPNLFSVNGTITSFFNDDRVRKALNAPREATVGEMWLECIPGSGRRRRRRRRRLEEFLSWQSRSLHLLDQDEPASVVPYIAELLDDAGVRVLVYNGDRDMSCCAQGSEEALAGMEWSGREGWLDPDVTRRGLWMVKGPRVDDGRAAGLQQELEVGGYTKSHGNLTFLVVYNSGHLVPTNRPRAALDLLQRFLKEEGFSDAELPGFATELKSSEIGDGDNQGESKFDRSQVVFISIACAIIGGVAAMYIFDKIRGRATYQQIPSSSVPGTPSANGIALQ